ncbi:MAG: MBL fold metallo-hydrolase [Verrucomicrobiota bacterium]
MKIKIWGTRGSIPTPSTAAFVTSCYGGDTTCVSIESGQLNVVLDGGSGLRQLGLEWSEKEMLEAHLFFSHVHWDHIQGFPFFSPAFRAGTTLKMYSPQLQSSSAEGKTVLEDALLYQQKSINFPIPLPDMPAAMTFHQLVEKSPVILEDGSNRLKIIPYALNHPGGCYGFRIEEYQEEALNAVFAFCTDHEHSAELNESVQAIAKDADLLLYDSQYTSEEYQEYIGWGHSTWQAGLKEAQAANTKRLLLHHHDPLHHDQTIAAMEADAKAAGDKLGIKTEAARACAEYSIGTNSG